MCEQQRIQFIIQRDGIEGAIDFARRTMKIYRTAVLKSAKRGHEKPHFASTHDWKRKFIMSYLAFKAFLQQHGRLQG